MFRVAGVTSLIMTALMLGGCAGPPDQPDDWRCKSQIPSYYAMYSGDYDDCKKKEKKAHEEVVKLWYKEGYQRRHGLRRSGSNWRQLECLIKADTDPDYNTPQFSDPECRAINIQEP